MMEELEIVFLDHDGRFSEILKRLENGETLLPETFAKGIDAWELQTFIALKQSRHLNVALHRTIPTKGILFCHAEKLTKIKKIPDSVFVVSCVADKGYDSRANIYIVQSPYQTNLGVTPFHVRSMRSARVVYMPHWPQYGLVPRNPNRGEKFENVAYLGREVNLHIDLKDLDFREEMNLIGLKFVCPEPSQWHDYSEIDCVISLRPDHAPILNKPASKLFNAWIAGVPAILGKEPACQFEGSPGKNYLEVSDAEQVLRSINNLKGNFILRKSLIDSGQIEASRLTFHQLAQKWLLLFSETILPIYGKWSQNSPHYRRWFRAWRNCLEIASKSRKLFNR